MATESVQDFVVRLNIRMTAEPIDHNPNMSDNATMDHWRVTFRRGRQHMTAYFSMGSGHKGRQPEAAEVMDTLASDVSTYESVTSFEEWCSDFGYDTDSRSAERTFRTIAAQSSRLCRFLGTGEYETLLWDTERL